MKPQFNVQEIELLKDLRFNEHWASILEKLKRREVPKYKKTGDNETQKIHEWIYDSGRSVENDYLLNQLGDLHE